jgi:hypothetical protein
MLHGTKNDTFRRSNSGSTQDKNRSIKTFVSVHKQALSSNPDNLMATSKHKSLHIALRNPLPPS